MKALLLAAGSGSRLGDLTKDTPKCLLKVNGITMLDFWISKLVDAGVTDILINTHYHHKKIENHIWNHSHFPLWSHEDNVDIKLIYEPELLGSAGFLYENRDYFKDDMFYIVYSDVWTDSKNVLQDMRYFHGYHGGSMTIGVYKSEKYYQCGMAKVYGNKVIGFAEKADVSELDNLTDSLNKNSDIFAFAGLAYVHPLAFNNLIDKADDIAEKFLPLSLNDMNAYVIKEKIVDIGTPETYKKANEEAANV